MGVCDLLFTLDCAIKPPPIKIKRTLLSIFLSALPYCAFLFLAYHSTCRLNCNNSFPSWLRYKRRRPSGLILDANRHHLQFICSVYQEAYLANMRPFVILAAFFSLGLANPVGGSSGELFERKVRRLAISKKREGCLDPQC
jgi:hypothetical protein